jgi:hypothetical protein
LRRRMRRRRRSMIVVCFFRGRRRRRRWSIIVVCFLQRRRRDACHVFMCAVKMAFHIVSSGKSHFTLWTCRRHLVKHVFPL